MTGRKLYDHFTDAVAEANDTGYYRNYTDLVGCERRKTFDGDNGAAIPVRAWAFLTAHDKAVWNKLARSITPKRRAS